MKDWMHWGSPYLLCDGEREQHVAPVPRVRADGATGPVECSECGARMMVVDLIVVERNPSWGSLEHDGQQRRYWS